MNVTEQPQRHHHNRVAEPPDSDSRAAAHNQSPDHVGGKVNAEIDP